MVVVELEPVVVDTVLVVWDAVLLVTLDGIDVMDAVEDPVEDPVVDDPVAEDPVVADPVMELTEPVPPVTANS